VSVAAITADVTIATDGTRIAKRTIAAIGQASTVTPLSRATLEAPVAGGSQSLEKPVARKSQSPEKPVAETPAGP
jgi:hypothetical protein